MEATDTSADPPDVRQASLVPTAIIGLAFLVVAVLFLYDSSWYFIFKTIHVLFAVIWIGGGALLTVYGLRAERAHDPGEILQVARMATFAGERIFAPSGIIVFAAGMGMVLNASMDFNQFWLIFGLIAFAATFLTGIAVLGPRAKRLKEIVAAEGPEAPETQAAISQILLIARFDIAMLLLVIIDMVAKPFV
jgi:uncharacterized membrane protein